MGKTVVFIPGVTYHYHGAGEATCDRFYSRKDGLVHQQSAIMQSNGLAYSLCGLRYNIYRRPGMRGLKGVPTTVQVTCMQCIAEGS